MGRSAQTAWAWRPGFPHGEDPGVTETSVGLRTPAVATSRLSASRLRALPVTAWLCAIVIVSTAIRAFVALTVPVPAIFPDELVYWELGRGIGETGHLAMRDEAVSAWTYGPLYPLVISPAHLVTGSLVNAYAVVKMINALLFSLAAVPAYFLARRVVSTRGALLAGALTLVVPSAVYSTRVMAESLAYPLFLCALLAMLRAVERPTRSRQAIALAVICLASFSRAEMAVLLPAFATTILVLAWREVPPRRHHLSPFALTWISLGVATAVAVALAAFGGLGPHLGLLGDMRLFRIPANVLWHFAELDLYSGVLPFAAFVLVAVSALFERSRPRHKLIVLTTCVAACLIVLAAAFESGIDLYGVYSTHVFDRYVFYLVPLFLIALLEWVEEGHPGPRRLTVAVASLAALLPLALPLGSLLHEREWGTSTSTVGLLPAVWAKAAVGEGIALRVTLLALSAGLAVAFVRFARGPVLACLATYVFVVFSLIAVLSNTALSQRAREDGIATLTWVDDEVGSGSVAILWRGDRAHPPSHRTALRQTEFFNHSIGPVYDLRHPLAGGIPSTPVRVRKGVVVDSDGAIRAEYVLAHHSVRVRGRPVARDPRSGLVLYRVGGAVRVVTGGAQR
jgi:dolichyl-phosphate-mannose-protein mannosyltransferase